MQLQCLQLQYFTEQHKSSVIESPSRKKAVNRIQSLIIRKYLSKKYMQGETRVCSYKTTINIQYNSIQCRIFFRNISFRSCSKVHLPQQPFLPADVAIGRHMSCRWCYCCCVTIDIVIVTKVMLSLENMQVSKETEQVVLGVTWRW